MTRALLGTMFATVVAAACHGVPAAPTPPAPAPAAPAEIQPAAGPAVHPVFNLIDNRLLAHVQRGGGVVVLAGSAGMAKYLNGGKPNQPWKLGQKLDGHRVAIPDGIARVTVPLGPEQSAGKLQLRLHAGKAGELEVIIRGKRAGKVAYGATGWQTVRLALPAGVAAPGENEVQLGFGKAAPPEVEWIQLGGDDAPDDAPRFYDPDKKSLVVPAGGGLAWYVVVPDKGRLIADVAAGCDVTVSASAGSRGRVDGVLKGAGAQVALDPLAGKVVRLELGARGCEARLTQAALAVPGPAPQVVRPKKPKNVVLWIMDSLRADKVRPFFPGARAEVPNWEKLAKTSTLFRATYVQGNESRGSHASIWTSRYVGSHRMIGEKDVLSSKFLTIGRAMKNTGLYTAGASSNGFIIARWGFGDGWDFLFNHIHAEAGTRAEDVWGTARKAVADHLAKPFFLYIGTVDTHVSWRAHEPWFAKYDPDPYGGPFKRAATDPEVDKIAAGEMSVTDRDKTRIVAFYDSDVSYQDDILGKVLEQFAAWKIDEDTLLVITADHGDEFWEDGRLGHGGSVRDTLVHVPLLIHYPPLFPAGVVEEGTDTIDILPTLLDALGAPVPAELQGESLIGIAQGQGRGYPRPAISSMYEDAFGMRLGDWKMILRNNGTQRLYDAVGDHLEKNDVADARPLERRFLTDSLATFLAYQKEWKKTRWGVASNHSEKLADDLEH